MMRLTIIGLGNQAKAWAENLKDSGFPLRVALQPNSLSFENAVKLGLETVEIGTPEFYADQAFAVLSPDHTHHSFMLENGHRFTEGSLILFAHGHSLLKNGFEKQFPHLQHVLFAPKSIGSELRKQFQLKGKLGAVYSLEHVKGDKVAIEKWLLKLAQHLGINMGPYKTSFLHETQADLYSEQGLLCSLVPYAASQMFTHLIEKGIEPELAYFECWHELKLIVNAMVDKGPEGFYDLISPNALIGSEKGYKKLMTSEFEARMKSLLDDIRTGAFEKELDEANVEGLRNTIRERWQKTPLMKTFREINRETP